MAPIKINNIWCRNEE